jgi:phosphatidylglycerol:prolipoprotein diacylglycerol transferase
MVDPIAWQFTLFGLSISIRWYGIVIAAGLLLAILLAMYHAKREGHDPDSILDVALVIIPMAVIFARIYYVIFNYSAVVYPDFPGMPGTGHSFWHVFAIWEGGLAIYGGVIGGFLGILIYNKFNKKIGLWNLLDIAAPSLILGQAIGRWGNFFNQEAYGMAVTNPAWQWFPAAVNITEPKIYGQEPGWYMATFFYESIWNLLVLAFLFFYFKNYKKRRPGDVFWFYLLLYGIGRAVIEGLRTDSLMLGILRVSQWLSVVLVLVAVCGLFWPKLSPVLSPVLTPVGKAIAAFFRRIGDASKKAAEDIKARRKAAEDVPLDDRLRLRVDMPDEEKAPEDSGAAKEAGEKPAEEEKKDEGKDAEKPVRTTRAKKAAKKEEDQS